MSAAALSVMGILEKGLRNARCLMMVTSSGGPKGLLKQVGEEARETLTGPRATYEPVIQGLADHLLIPLPAWLAENDTPDHWEPGARGIIASRLISGLADGPLSEASARSDANGPGWVGHVRKRPRSK